MSKQPNNANTRPSVSRGLDQLADLASAVANSVHGSSQDSGSDQQVFAKYATHSSASAAHPVGHLDLSKASLPTSLVKGNSSKQRNLLSFGELENAISSRRMGFSENSPLLPLYHSPVGQFEERSSGTTRVATLAAVSALVVSVLFIFGLWLSGEIVLAYRATLAYLGYLFGPVQ
ncbi:hypothetical protein OXX80_009002 [Metschnikowia pulcherrima]